MDFAIIPRKVFAYMKIDSLRAYHLNVMFSSLLVIMAMFLVYGPATSGALIPNVCLIDAFFGIHCPFCGTTRALGAFFHGDFIVSWQYNRAAALLALYLIIQIPARYIMMKKRMELNHSLCKAFRIASWILLSIFIINWIINILTNNLT